MSTNIEAPMPVPGAHNCTVCMGGTCEQFAETIYVDNNATGRRMYKYVPELGFFEQAVAGDMAEYVNPNANRGPVGQAVRANLASMEGVKTSQILIDGSGLNRIKFLPALLGAKAVMSVRNDFPGYKLGRIACRLPYHEIPCDIWARSLDPQVAADSVRDVENPVVFLSMPVTNPGQTLVGIDTATAILETNETAFVVIDAAYRRDSAYNEDYVKYALSHPRVLYLNVAAKELGACGARVCWMIGQPETLARISPDVCPYPISMHSARYVSALAARPNLVSKIHSVQKSANEIYRHWLPDTGLTFKSGAGPWVLVDLGAAAGQIVDELATEHHILVQDQSGNVDDLNGWVRISANVPCDAKKVVEALGKVTAKYPVVKKQ